MAKAKTKVAVVEPVQSDLELAEERAADAYSDLQDVLDNNSLLGHNRNGDRNGLLIGMTTDSWGASCPEPPVQLFVVEAFFKTISSLSMPEVMKIIAALMVNADAETMVEYEEEQATEYKELVADSK